jgi:hypothetical protein
MLKKEGLIVLFYIVVYNGSFPLVLLIVILYINLVMLMSLPILYR